MAAYLENPAALLFIPAALALAAFIILHGRRRVYPMHYRVVHPLARIVAVKRRRPWAEYAVIALRLAAVAMVLAAAAAPYTPVPYPSSAEEYVRLNIKYTRKPLVILVLDVSGSMYGEKLENAKQALYMFLDNIGNATVLGFIAFSDQVRYAVPPTTDKRQIREAIARLEAEGGTMYTYPLQAALTWAKPFRDLGLNVTIIFASDGIPYDFDTDMFNEVFEEIIRENITIDTIFIYTPELPEAENRAAQEILWVMANKTGGVAVGPKYASELPTVYRQLATQARETSHTVAVRTTIEVSLTYKEYMFAALLVPALLLYAASLLLRSLYQRTGA